jgi:transcriptional regulator with XRE-family HTH domain
MSDVKLTEEVATNAGQPDVIAPSDAVAPATLPESVGDRLRLHRTEQDLSVRGLARDVGVSASLISQIEHGKASPSVATLYAIVSQLGISMDALFFDSPRGASKRDRAKAQLMKSGVRQWEAPSDGPVLRSGSRLSLTLDTGVRWERLTASHDPDIEFLYCTYPVGSESCPPDGLMTHSGHEYGIVQSGRLGATVGAESYELEAGDSLAFDSTTPHRLWAIGTEDAIAIWIVASREDDPRVQ